MPCSHLDFRNDDLNSQALQGPDTTLVVWLGLFLRCNAAQLHSEAECTCRTSHRRPSSLPAWSGSGAGWAGSSQLSQYPTAAGTATGSIPKQSAAKWPLQAVAWPVYVVLRWPGSHVYHHYFDTLSTTVPLSSLYPTRFSAVRAGRKG